MKLSKDGIGSGITSVNGGRESREEEPQKGDPLMCLGSPQIWGLLLVTPTNGTVRLPGEHSSREQRCPAKLSLTTAEEDPLNTEGLGKTLTFL